MSQTLAQHQTNIGSKSRAYSCESTSSQIFGTKFKWIYYIILHWKSKREVYASWLKQLRRFTSLNHNIYIAADRIPVDLEQDAHACGPTMFTQREHNYVPSRPRLQEHIILYSTKI